MANVYHILDYALAAIPADDPATCSDQHIRPVRGIGWVLKWAAAICVLFASAVVLLNFAYRLAAEQTLSQAATAGIRAAALPRATSRSVEQSIRRELGYFSQLSREATVLVNCAGKPVKGAIAPGTHDKISVTLSVPAEAALPSWLRPLSCSNGQAVISTHIDHAG